MYSNEIKFKISLIFYETQTNLEEAIKKLKHIYDVVKKIKSSEDDLIIRILILHGLIEKDLSNYESSMKLLDNAFKQLKIMKKQVSPCGAQILFYLGYLYENHGSNLAKIQTALKTYELYFFF